MTAMRAAAFFDLDGTLLTANSGRLWMHRERRLGRLTLGQIIEGTLYLFAYRFHALDMEQVTVRALRTVQGEQEESVRQWTRAWFYDEVVPHEAPGARAALAAHRERGDLLVLLTSASLYESEAATDFFEMDAFLCTRYEVRDGTFTGDIVRPLCYGAGKVLHAERYAAEHDVDLVRSTFYTDSFSDIPMLRRVGSPRVVGPDLRLRLAAWRNRWPILDWAGPNHSES
jgi:HAD superfamily hydrolase (TIGR01490 family)